MSNLPVRPAVARALAALNAAPNKALKDYELAMAARVTPEGYGKMVRDMECDMLISRNETGDTFRWEITLRGLCSLEVPAVKLELAAGAYGRGMAAWERGEISGHELSQLKRQLKRAEQRVETEKAGAL
jgi:hypothetical protein